MYWFEVNKTLAASSLKNFNASVGVNAQVAIATSWTVDIGISTQCPIRHVSSKYCVLFLDL